MRTLDILVIGLLLIGSGCHLFSRHTDEHSELIKDTPFVEIREKGWAWETLSNDMHTAIGETLYVDDDCWHMLDPNSPRAKGLMKHESVHAERQKEMGLACWLFYYIMDRTFRAEEEMIAYEAGWRVELECGARYMCLGEAESQFRALAEKFSGASYCYMMEYNEAYEWISTTIKRLHKELGIPFPKA